MYIFFKNNRTVAERAQHHVTEEKKNTSNFSVLTKHMSCKFTQCNQKCAANTHNTHGVKTNKKLTFQVIVNTTDEEILNKKPSQIHHLLGSP